MASGHAATEAISITDTITLETLRVLLGTKRELNISALPLWSGCGAAFRNTQSMEAALIRGRVYMCLRLRRAKLSSQFGPIRSNASSAEVLLLSGPTPWVNAPLGTVVWWWWAWDDAEKNISRISLTDAASFRKLCSLLLPWSMDGWDSEEILITPMKAHVVWRCSWGEAGE